MRIIITGSSGYIGTCCYEYLKNKFEVYGIDKIRPFLLKQKKFFLCNLNNYIKLNFIISNIRPDLIIHLAGQSTIDGIKNKRSYEINNFNATRKLVKICQKENVKYFIFSSTAAVYKSDKNILKEKSQLGPDNIYGTTKLKCEKFIKKKFKKSSTNYIIFRFFNVCSSLYKLKVGEYHKPETHFIPIIVQKDLKTEKIQIYGNNYKTNDGTCIRDYIHIKDLLIAFVKAISFLKKNNKSEVINLGTGKGYSNLEILKSLKNKNNFIFVKKRKGDKEKLVCSNEKAKKLLNWLPKYSNLKKIINDEHNWLKFLKKKKINRNTIY
jgi:UDP-glucose 4-epimerase